MPIHAEASIHRPAGDIRTRSMPAPSVRVKVARRRQPASTASGPTWLFPSADVLSEKPSGADLPGESCFFPAMVYLSGRSSDFGGAVSLPSSVAQLGSSRRIRRLVSWSEREDVDFQQAAYPSSEAGALTGAWRAEELGLSHPCRRSGATRSSVASAVILPSRELFTNVNGPFARLEPTYGQGPWGKKNEHEQ